MGSKLPTRYERISSKIWPPPTTADDDDIDGAGGGGSDNGEEPEDEESEIDADGDDDDADKEDKEDKEAGARNTSRHTKISCADRAKISTDEAPPTIDIGG